MIKNVFTSIFLFGINKYLNGNVRNIICSLLRIAAFDKQQRLEDKIAEDIPQIAEFGFVV